MTFILRIIKLGLRVPKWFIVTCLLVLSSYAGANERCVPTGQWLAPESHTTFDNEQALQRITSRPIMLFGEHHQNPYHHQWHLKWLERLHEVIDPLEIAIEMLPVQSQPVINQWMQNNLSDAEFIEQSGWDEYWSHDVNLYLPVLKFAKKKQIPIHAINVSKQLFKEVSTKGWAEIPNARREGMTDPGPASRAYLIQLARSFRRHTLPSGEEITEEEGNRFKRFIEVQLLWDRAMAEGIARVRQQPHAPKVMAMMGSGHMMHGFGTPSQLDHMGISGHIILVPWDDHLDCNEIKPGFADLVYGAPPNQ